MRQRWRWIATFAIALLASLTLMQTLDRRAAAREEHRQDLIAGALVMAHTGDFAAAKSSVAEASQLGAAPGTIEPITQVIASWRPDDALSSQALDALSQLGPARQGWADFVAGERAYQKGDLAAAERHFREAKTHGAHPVAVDLRLVKLAQDQEKWELAYFLASEAHASESLYTLILQGSTLFNESAPRAVELLRQLQPKIATLSAYFGALYQSALEYRDDELDAALASARRAQEIDESQVRRDEPDCGHPAPSLPSDGASAPQRGFNAGFSMKPRSSRFSGSGLPRTWSTEPRLWSG